MPIIYLDRLFLFNALIDYLLCLTAGRIAGLCLRRGRYALAGLFGGLYAAATLLPGLRALAGPVGKLASAALMALIAYGGERRFWRCAGIFLAVSAAFGGAVWAISLGGGGQALPVSGRVLLLSFALCYGAVSLLFRGRHALPDRPRAEVRLGFLGRECRFMALRDTGNSLRDPVTGRAVMLVSPHALLPALPEAGAIFSGDPVAALERAAALPDLQGRLRLIPYAAVGTTGLLPVFRPDSLTLDGQAEPDLLVAVSPSAAGDGFEGIV